MYKLSKSAAKDFETIYSYTFKQWGENQADDYTKDLEACLQSLSKSPLIGRDYKKLKDGIRRHDHNKHAIYYRIRENDIFIVRLLHQQMNPLIHNID